MKAGKKVAAPASAEKQLASFIKKFDPKNQALIRSVRKVLRKRLPTANELVWDNYNFFVIGYCTSERPSDCIVSIAAGASGVGLAFYYGAKLPDPNHVLLGSGSQKPLCPDRIGCDPGAPGDRRNHRRRNRAGQDAARGERPRQTDHSLHLKKAEAAPQISEVSGAASGNLTRRGHMSSGVPFKELNRGTLPVATVPLLQN